MAVEIWSDGSVFDEKFLKLMNYVTEVFDDDRWYQSNNKMVNFVYFSIK